MHLIKKEFGEKNERRPLVGTVRRLGNTPFPTQRIDPFVTRPAVGTYGTLNVSSLPSPPPEIIWQYPFDQRSAAAFPMEVKCIKLYRRQNVI